MLSPVLLGCQIKTETVPKLDFQFFCRLIYGDVIQPIKGHLVAWLRKWSESGSGRGLIRGTILAFSLTDLKITKNKNKHMEYETILINV